MALNLLSQSINGGLLVGDRAYKAFVVSSQVFVSNQEGKEEAGHLGNSPPLLPSPGPLPVCLPACQGV